MRFLKRLSPLLLAMLSLCSLSLVACKEEIIKNSTPTRPSVESELPESVTSEESANSEASSNSENQNNIFTATSCDVTIHTVLAEDKKSVLIEATPLYHIYNLQIETKFVLEGNAVDSHINTFEKAPAQKTISFQVYLSDSILEKEEQINIYQCDVINGQYTARISHIQLGSSFINPNHPSASEQITCFEMVISEDGKSAHISFLPAVNLYGLSIEFSCTLNDERIWCSQSITPAAIFKDQLYCCIVYVPGIYQQQGFTIQEIGASFVFDDRQYPYSAPNEYYWAQFE